MRLQLHRHRSKPHPVHTETKGCPSTFTSKTGSSYFSRKSGVLAQYPTSLCLSSHLQHPPHFYCTVFVHPREDYLGKGGRTDAPSSSLRHSVHGWWCTWLNMQDFTLYSCCVWPNNASNKKTQNIKTALTTTTKKKLLVNLFSLF